MKDEGKMQALSIKIRIGGYFAALILPAFFIYTISIFPNLTLDGYGELLLLVFLPAGLGMLIDLKHDGLCLALGYSVFIIHAILTIRTKRIWSFSLMLILLIALMLLSYRGCSHMWDGLK